MISAKSIIKRSEEKHVLKFLLNVNQKLLSVHSTKELIHCKSKSCEISTSWGGLFFSILYFIRMEISTSKLAIFPPLATVKSIVKGGNQHTMGWSFFSIFALLGCKFPSIRLQHSNSL